MESHFHLVSHRSLWPHALSASTGNTYGGMLETTLQLNKAISACARGAMALRVWRWSISLWKNWFKVILRSQFVITYHFCLKSWCLWAMLEISRIFTPPKVAELHYLYHHTYSTTVQWIDHHLINKFWSTKPTPFHRGESWRNALSLLRSPGAPKADVISCPGWVEGWWGEGVDGRTSSKWESESLKRNKQDFFWSFQKLVFQVASTFLFFVCSRGCCWL